MGLKCNLFGCRKYDYVGEFAKKCKSCGTEYSIVKFYPGRPASWLEKSYLEHWKTYDNLVNTPMACEACGNELGPTEGCGAC